MATEMDVPCTRITATSVKDQVHPWTSQVLAAGTNWPLGIRFRSSIWFPLYPQ